MEIGRIVFGVVMCVIYFTAWMFLYLPIKIRLLNNIILKKKMKLSYKKFGGFIFLSYICSTKDKKNIFYGGL